MGTSMAGAGGLQDWLKDRSQKSFMLYITSIRSCSVKKTTELCTLSKTRNQAAHESLHGWTWDIHVIVETTLIIDGPWKRKGLQGGVGLIVCHITSLTRLKNYSSHPNGGGRLLPG